ncbi:MAG: hypothetical protein U9R15_18460, partial [Chloroflexota bacterium]|nr:hypothetical protein [Chloroflexota bacterium]
MASAATTAPPKITYPTSPASYTAPGSTTPGTVAKSALMAPQSGRYGQSPIASSPIASSAPSGFVNPVYQKPGSTSPLAQNPYRSTTPTAPSSNGSLGGPTTVATTSPYGNNTNSRYQAAISSSAARSSAPSYSNDPNSRYYTGSPTTSTASTAAAPFGTPKMPKVVGGYPATSSGSPVISTA